MQKYSIMIAILLLIPTTAIASVAINTSNAFEGAALITPQSGSNSPEGTNEFYLIDNSGAPINTWTLDLAGGQFAELQPDKTILYRLNAKAQPVDLFDDIPASIMHLNWEGETLWEYKNKFFHHDFDMTPEGNVLAILWEPVSETNKSTLGISQEFWSDKIVEIDYDTQNIIWQWSLQDHLNLQKVNVTRGQKELSHVNSLEYIPASNSFNGAASAIFSSRTLSDIFILNLETNEIDWQWGSGELDGPHDPSLLDNGNVLIFDNGESRGWSRAVEVDPNTNQIVWEYRASDLAADRISGAQRLPNGNTLITEGTEGRLVEVTESKEIAWEYVYSGSNGRVDIFKAAKYNLQEQNEAVEKTSSIVLPMIFILAASALSGIFAFLITKKRTIH